MSPQDWIDLVKGVSWPLIALGALIYIWRSDAINKLLRISEAVKELQERLGELIIAEEGLRRSTGALSELKAIFDQLQSDFVSIRADVENIRDKVDQKPEITQPQLQTAAQPQNMPVSERDLEGWFADMDRSWQALEKSLTDKFDWFDRRMTGSEAYRFAHGNRKGAKLSYDQADEVARLHSSIKSYRRRQASLADWLDKTIRDEFVNSATSLSREIKDI